VPEGSIRARLLTETSTRAFAALRARATSSLARIRLAAGVAFCAMAALFTLFRGEDIRLALWPLLAYALVSLVAQRWAGRGGWRDRLASFAPLADVLFVFVLQSQTLHLPQAEFGAGWTLGLYALVVGFSGLSLRARVVAATAAMSFAALAILQARAGIWWGGIAASGIVLGLVAMVTASVVRELDRVVARLVVNEVEHEQLRRAQTEAETLTHLLVHDMKGPLTGLIGLAEVVANELSGPLKSDVKMIEQQGRRLQTMVTDLLAIARLERGVLDSPPEAVDLSALLSSLADSYSATARQTGAQILARVEPGLSATLHREMIRRLYDNLVLNALDFVSPGGRIEVAARQEGQDLLLSVRNTGEPVPSEARVKLFQKSARAGRRGQHNFGLGLYLCRLVALAHDGTIALEEEAGWAASFVARLPVEARKAALRLRPQAGPPATA
jgi:signal transduction histidine kinase